MKLAIMPWRLGHRLDQALEHDRFVRRLEDLAAAPEHDLHLTRRIFRDQRPGRQALYLRKGVEIGEKWCKIVEILEIVGLVMQRPRGHGQRTWEPAGYRSGRHRGPSGRIRARPPRPAPCRCSRSARIHPAQQIARIGVAGVPSRSCMVAIYCAEGSPTRAWSPGTRHRPQQQSRSPSSKTRPVSGTSWPVTSRTIAEIGKIAAVLPCRRQVVPPEQLAALHAAEIRPHQMEGADVRELRQEGLGLQGAVRDDDRHVAASRLRSGPGLSTAATGKGKLLLTAGGRSAGFLVWISAGRHLRKARTWDGLFTLTGLSSTKATPRFRSSIAAIFSAMALMRWCLSAAAG